MATVRFGRPGLAVVLVWLAVACVAAGAEVRLATCAADPRLCPEATGLVHPHAPAPGARDTFSGGVSVGDFNRDGWQDLFVVTGGEGPDRLFLNRGDGTFREAAQRAGVAAVHRSHGSVLGDVGGTDGVVRTFIRFMASWYSQSDPTGLDDRHVVEASQTDDRFTSLYQTALRLPLGGPKAHDDLIKRFGAVLSTLPTNASLPDSAVRALVVVSVHLGPACVLDLIQRSPAADLLLPLVTALQQEVGLKRRVAREVDEVAQDIRKELARWRRLVPLSDTITGVHN